MVSFLCYITLQSYLIWLKILARAQKDRDIVFYLSNNMVLDH